MKNQRTDKNNGNLPIVLATLAGMFMVAAAMFFSISQMGAINNNQIGLEEAKFMAQYNISLQSYGELNSLVPINNKIAIEYGLFGGVLFIISLALGIIAYNKTKQ